MFMTVGHIVIHVMSEQHTVYYPDEEEDLAQWVENHEDVLGGRSNLYKRAVKLLKEEHGAEIDSLSVDEHDVLT